MPQLQQHAAAVATASTLQQQQQLAAVLVQVPTNLYMYACCRGGSAACTFWLFSQLALSRPSKLAIAASSSAVICVPSPVLPHIELPVSARHHTTRILLHARSLLFVAAAAVRGEHLKLYPASRRVQRLSRFWLVSVMIGLF